MNDFGRPAAAGVPEHYALGIINVIKMLIDYVVASPGLSLAEIKVADTQAGDKALDAAAILTRVTDIERMLVPESQAEPNSRDLAFLQLARDALVRKAWPASGLTIAFTSMVSNQTSKTRANLAERAYPDLKPLARHMRLSRNLVLALAIVVTLIAGWESAKVALGHSLLQSLETLRNQQAALDLERNRLETSLDGNAEKSRDVSELVDDDGRVNLTAFSLCNRPFAMAYYLLQKATVIPPDPGSTRERTEAERKATADHAALRDVDLPPVETMKIYGSAAERDVCEKARVLGFSFDLLHRALQQYSQDWPAMAGSVFSLTASTVDQAIVIACRILGCGKPAGSSAAGGTSTALDVEVVIAPVLLVWGNYVLPVIFGLLGSNIFVVLDLFNKIRTSTLHPRDAVLSWIRLVLGMVTGACIGLFFSGSGPPPGASAASLVNGLSLSASGLAFLAGFGVEGVFTMLEGLVRQAFPGTASAKADR